MISFYCFKRSKSQFDIYLNTDTHTLYWFFSCLIIALAKLLCQRQNFLDSFTGAVVALVSRYMVIVVNLENCV